MATYTRNNPNQLTNRNPNPMKPKTLEDALFETGAPDEIILLAMIEACLQDDARSLKGSWRNDPFASLLLWIKTQQGADFWHQIDKHYFIRTP